jgi:hypothetical protein
MMNVKATRRWKRKFNARNILRALLLLLLVGGAAAGALWFLHRWSQ